MKNEKTYLKSVATDTEIICVGDDVKVSLGVALHSNVKVISLFKEYDEDGNYDVLAKLKGIRHPCPVNNLIKAKKAGGDVAASVAHIVNTYGPIPNDDPIYTDEDMDVFIQAHEAFHGSQNRHTQFEHTAARTIGMYRAKLTAALLEDRRRLVKALNDALGHMGNMRDRYEDAQQDQVRAELRKLLKEMEQKI